MPARPPTDPDLAITADHAPVTACALDDTEDDAPRRVAVGSGDRQAVTGRAPKYEPGEIAERPPNLRLAELETWREYEIDPWRRRLTGHAETNGRIGRMDQRIEANHVEVTAAIETLRTDVGPSEERAAERAQAKQIANFKKWSLAKLMGAAGAIAVAAYGFLRVREEARDAAASAKAAAAAAAARSETRLDHLEATVRTVLDTLLHRQRTP